MGERADHSGFVIPPRYWSWLGNRLAIAALLWLITLLFAGVMLYRAWNWFGNDTSLAAERQRLDGNSGHVQIDFGGQWVMGRMVVQGHARELYHRQRQWEVVRDGFPVADEPPVCQEESHVPGSQRTRAKPTEDLKHDADRLMSWFMGTDPKEWQTVGGAAVAPLAAVLPANPIAATALQQASAEAVSPAIIGAVARPAVGGPLYPPVHAFLYAPIGLFDRPLAAYHVFQVFATLMILISGLGVRVLTRGRIWWSVATLALFLYSGTRAGLDLGQNPAVTLSIVVWGWALASRGYNTAGGMVWGLFAFKPVWALAFCIVPLLTRRWRFCAAMVATGVSLCAATIPFVGIETWLDWLTVGKEAAALYNVNQNWIHLCRDLHGIPRRILHDFGRPEAERDTALAQALAWSLWGTVFAATVAVYYRFADHRRATGVGIAFLFFGAWLTCYRFMYYDSLISAIGCAVLFAEPMRFLRARAFEITLNLHEPLLGRSRVLPDLTGGRSALGPRMIGVLNSFPFTILAMLLLIENSVNGMSIEGTIGFGYYSHVTTGPGGTTGRVTPRVVADTSSSYPWETLLVFSLWVWCGWQLIRGEERQCLT